ncbi:S9 family peptidase [Pedobacter sp. Leaf176]|uniref:alpha/beta hydrolase family protein n=1 Tax=Pedobacter sp. Leaf176 TaxID=1736286 RepID=UPI0006FDECC0|nr:alpha/beta fold hydrolase [Pedobacter sp. Leaf176]KQR67724.1 hypothetical protein ASF92_18815 [Pedobacter sp. Leaf176]
MKPYLFILFCCISGNVFAQKSSDAVRTFDYTIKNVSLKSAGVSLSASIFTPKKPRAGIVLVHGSGKEPRMTKMAILLAQQGIAVITYDKRGVGESGGIYMGPEAGTNNIDSTNLNLLASDASEALNALLQCLPSKRVPIGLMGFSQAGWVIPLAAFRNQKVKYMVLFSGPVVSTLEQLRFQFFTQGNTKFWDNHTEAEARQHIRSDPDKYKFEPTDPGVALSSLSIPGLWIFGGRDIQVPVNISIEHLDTLKAQGKPYVYKLYPDLGHNTAVSSAPDPVSFAIRWIKSSAVLKNRK